MPTWSNAGSLPPGSLPRNISAKSSAIAIFGPSPSFLEENENPTPTPRRWRNMKLSRSQPSTKLGTPSRSPEKSPQVGKRNSGVQEQEGGPAEEVFWAGELQRHDMPVVSGYGAEGSQRKDDHIRVPLMQAGCEKEREIEPRKDDERGDAKLQAASAEWVACVWFAAGLPPEIDQ